MKDIIVVLGPTGVGKTKMSVELAKKFNGEVISADSAQIYRDLNIGTAKVTDEEMDGIAHHLISIKDVNEKYSVYNFQMDGRKLIEDIHSRGKTVIVAGGTGLYITALLYDYKFAKEDNVYDFDSLSDNEMYNALIELDTSLEIDKRNRQRLIRAYAKYINNSEPIVSNESGNKLLYKTHFIGLTTNRDKLYDRINKRVDMMIEEGLIREVRDIYNKYPNCKELGTIIGYKEFSEYINGNDSLENVITNIKQNSRNYAKRQYTWFNHKMDVKWFDVNFDDFDNTVKEVISYIS